MRRVDLINSSHVERRAIKGMQVLGEQSNVYFNFINSLNSESLENILVEHVLIVEKFLLKY